MKTGSGIPPWHLWGGSEVVQVAEGSVVAQGVSLSRQLCRIAYKRPETWHWCFAAQLLEGTAAPAATAFSVTIDWKLTIGVGRAQLTIPSFDRFQWTWGPSADAPINQLKFSFSALGPNKLDGAPDPLALGGRTLTNAINFIVGQDIQLEAVCRADSSGGPVTAKVELSAFFAPQTHVRPDWGIDHFNGGELGGG